MVGALIGGVLKAAFCQIALAGGVPSYRLWFQPIAAEGDSDRERYLRIGFVEFFADRG